MSLIIGIILTCLLFLFILLAIYFAKILLRAKHIKTFVLTTLMNVTTLTIMIPYTLAFYNVNINYSLRIFSIIFIIVFLLSFIVWFIKVPLANSKNVPKPLLILTLIFLSLCLIPIGLTIFQLVKDVMQIG